MPVALSASDGECYIYKTSPELNNDRPYKRYRNIERLHYIDGVIKRAEHHANNVENVVLAIAGAIVWRKDDEPIEVFTRQGELKNVIWLKINGNKYAFSYNHEEQQIEIRTNTTQRDVLRSFNNSTSLDEIKSFFKEL